MLPNQIEAYVFWSADRFYYLRGANSANEAEPPTTIDEKSLMRSWTTS